MIAKEKKSVYLREERDRALFRAYSKAISEFDFATQSDALDYARLQQAPRFYIEGEFCLMVINRMKAGKPMGVTGEARIRKFNVLYERFLLEREKPRNHGKSTLDICNIIVEQPAPEFFITTRSARLIVATQKEIQCNEILRRAKR